MPRGSEEQERLPGELCFHFRHLLFPLISFFLSALPLQLCTATVLLLIGGHNNSYTHTHAHTHRHTQMNSSFTHLQSRSEAGCGLVRSDRRFLHIFFRFFAFWSVFFYFCFRFCWFCCELRCALSAAAAAAVFFVSCDFFLPNKKRIKKQSKINARPKEQEEGEGEGGRERGYNKSKKLKRPLPATRPF